ncbi:DUF4349 domain-containing protein [Flavobacterium sp. JP2137]|uniref:DUF4349 domain-containing protein n=1 Tax=Flavobacterium sp. JP2137 TaxID=3414510 RepID=UPI003D2FDC74
MRYHSLILSLFVLFVGCGQNTSSKSDAMGGANALALDVATDAVVAESAGEERDVETKIIKTGTIRYEVKDLEKSFSSLNKQIQANGGFIQNDHSGNQSNYAYRTIIVRIPSKNFDLLLDSIGKEVAYFDTKTITATDVTEEFIDVEARLKNKKTLENRYLELLGKTQQIAEILEIEKSLSTIREEVESVQGRLNYLKNQVSYSTLTIEIYHSSASGTGITESYPLKMWQAVVSGFNSLSGFILGLLSLWPYLMITAAILVLVRKKVWKRRSKSQIDKEQ